MFFFKAKLFRIKSILLKKSVFYQKCLVLRARLPKKLHSFEPDKEQKNTKVKFAKNHTHRHGCLLCICRTARQSSIAR